MSAKSFQSLQSRYFQFGPGLWKSNRLEFNIISMSDLLVGCVWSVICLDWCQISSMGFAKRIEELANNWLFLIFRFLLLSTMAKSQERVWICLTISTTILKDLNSFPWYLQDYFNIVILHCKLNQKSVFSMLRPLRSINFSHDAEVLYIFREARQGWNRIFNTVTLLSSFPAEVKLLNLFSCNQIGSREKGRCKWVTEVYRHSYKKCIHSFQQIRLWGCARIR